MSRWPLIALALSGCDFVLGLEAVDDPPIAVTGTYRYRTVVNDSAFEPSPVEEILPVGSFGLEAILDDGTESPLQYRADGTFRFPIAFAGQGYRLRLLIDGVTGEWQHSAPTLVLGNMSAGHRNRRPVVQSTIQFNYMPATVGRTATVATTGLYTISDTAMAGPVVSFDWRLASPTSAALLGMLEADEHDRAYAIEFEATTTGNSPAWSRYHAVASDSITLAPGMIATLPQPVAQPPNSCMHVLSNSADEAIRISNTHPRDYYETRGDWIAFAMPAPSFVGTAGAHYPAICGYVTAKNLDITPSFYDPYPGTTLVAEAATISTFLVQLGGAASTGISNVTRVYAVADRGNPASCNPATASLEAHIGIPGAFELDGISLDSDNVEIPAPQQAPTLQWRILADGPVDYTSVSLQELRAINGKTILIPRWSAVTTTTSAIIEPSELEVGHTYIVQVQAAIGRPNAASGDLMTIAPPFELSSIWTHTFVVR